ncbi:MAG TPA: antibiotic biosynthesis monooxygenase [Thermoanaerobaculia bacterium]
MFCYLFEFRVRAGAEARFEAAYGADGPWVALFRRSPEYLGTELGRDTADARRYLTIDRWTSRAACLDFRERVRAEFDAIDRECELLTESERHLGDFDLRR